ncbi:MAG: transketolase, partial [Candidatus Omnitrophica bacterium]|nr:transketolase [Candidatus Omnitrophota bacterium]
VGMAVAERFMAASFNRPGFEMVNHHVYMFAGDGDMMEGITYEAASLAGHLKLGKLICLYDDNKITIDGSVDLAYSENTAARFEAAGWHVQTVSGADTDLDAIEKAIQAARERTDAPSLVILKTTIGYGAPHKQNTSGCHGAPLGAEEVRGVKRALGFSEDQSFVVPEEVRKTFESLSQKAAKGEADWKTLFAGYAGSFA